MNNLKLVVEVIRAHNLLPKHSQNSSNTFVELHFDDQKSRTTIKQNDLDPFWNETFHFKVSNPIDLLNLTLEAHVYNVNKTTNSKYSLGKIRINGTSFVAYSDAVVFNYPLEKGGVFSRARGELGLKVYVADDLYNNKSSSRYHDMASSSSYSSLHSIQNELPIKKVEEGAVFPDKNRPTQTFYNPSSSNSQQKAEPQQQRSNVRIYPKPSPQPSDFTVKQTSPYHGRVKHSNIHDLVEPVHYLFVRVVKARNLPSKDITGSLDPYVEVKLGNYKGVTRHLEKTQNPEWNTVFAFSKERLQSYVLEVVVKDKDMVRDDFVGIIRIDLHEIPMRVPPNSPLAPEWYRLEDKKGENKKGELMLAAWIGTQTDEAFNNAFHSDIDSSVPLKHFGSKVYISPRLWYVRVNVIEAQDLIFSDKNRFPNVFVKAQIGNHVLKTKSVQPQNMNVFLWNEDLMFVAGEPFDEHLVVSVEDRVGLNKDETLGKVFVPLSTVERRVDDRIVHSRWLSLKKTSSTANEEKKKDNFASKIHLRVCLDGGYHVLDESTHYSTDLRPTAKQLLKPPIGTLELGILNADGLTPMKTRNGRGTSDTFCVAKYGQKWVRTRTITDSLSPKYNEQYAWDVFDPSTVLTIGVFDHGQISDEKGLNGNNGDKKIGKVRIRVSTLENDRVYSHIYPLLVLHPSGVKKMGELHLAIRFLCTSMVNMMRVYSKPLLPKMHYVRPLSLSQMDILRSQAVNILVARLSRAEPPLRKEVIEYMADADSHLWSVRRSKANFLRLMSVLNGFIVVKKWINDVCTWKNTVTTVLVHILFLILICSPEFILPAFFLYMFVIGIWNYRSRPRHPPHMNVKLSCADNIHSDELDEEFDSFPTTRSFKVVRMRYDRVRFLAGRVQRLVGDIASQGERVQALLSWRDPRATLIFMVFCIVSAITLYVVPFQLLIVVWGFYGMRHPRFRHKLPSLTVNFFRRLPARTDSLL